MNNFVNIHRHILWFIFPWIQSIFIVANPQFDPQLRVFFLVSSIHMKRNIQNIDYLHFENGKVIGKVDSEKRPMFPLVVLLLQYENQFYLEQIVLYNLILLLY